MIVMKFGGTSVQDAAALRTVCSIVGREKARTPLVVVSACSGVTDVLIEIAHLAGTGNLSEARKAFSKLRQRHESIADNLLSSEAHVAKETLSEQFSELESLVMATCGRSSIGPRDLDSIVAYGELWSSALLTLALLESGAPAQLVDARSVMITDDESPANPLPDFLGPKARSIVLPVLQEGTIVVTQGFIGSTTDGKTTTLGRGGSDFSASLLGAALGAEEIQIWTDVDGILTADPSVVPEARLIDSMTFQEAAELAYFGAKVLHPGTILPAVRREIPVRVLNSKHPGVGTLITRRTAAPAEGIVKSIAYKEGITTVTIQSTRKLMNYGFLARVFSIFEKHRKNIDVVATSEVGVSLTVDNRSNLSEIVDEFSGLADVRVEHQKAVLCVVGETIKYAQGIAGRVFMALSDAGVNIELISHGGSEINLTFVIAEQQVQAAVKALHEEFFSMVGNQVEVSEEL